MLNGKAWHTLASFLTRTLGESASSLLFSCLTVLWFINRHVNPSESSPGLELTLWLYLYARRRDHYAATVTPLIINAQRKLLERIDSFGGPAVPQPHHVMTQKTSGREVLNICVNPFYQDTYVPVPPRGCFLGNLSQLRGLPTCEWVDSSSLRADSRESRLPKQKQRSS